MDLLKDSVKNLYFRYLFPSMGSAVVASVYLMTDAVVIGKGIGDNALAALNMTTPIISLCCQSVYCLVLAARCYSVYIRVRVMTKKQINALPQLCSVF